MSADRQEMEPTVDDDKPTTTTVVETQPDASPAREPAAGDGVKEPSVVTIAPHVFTLVAFASLAVFTVATCIEWVFKYTPTESEKYTLWQRDFANVTEYTFNIRVEDFACDEQMHYFRGVEAFALLSIFTSSIMVIVGILARTGRIGLKGPGGFFAFLTFAFSLVAWGIAIATYYKEFCNVESFKRRRYEIGPGAGLFITGWVFSFVAFVVVLVNPTIPKVVLETHLATFASTVYGIFAIPAFVFAVIAAPIPLFYVWTTQNTQTEATSYHLHYYVNDDQVSKQTWGSLMCGSIESMARASQAFAIVTILASAAALVCGYRFYTNAAPNARRLALLAAVVAAVAGMIKFAADMSLYYFRFCDTPSLHAAGFQLGAGFALSTAVWVLHLVNVVVLTIVILAQKYSKGTLDIARRWPGILFVAFTLVSLLLCVLAASQTILYLEKDVNIIRYFWWNYQATIGGNSLLRSKDYPCSDLEDLMLAGGAMVIIAIAVLCFTAILGVGQFYNAVLRKPASMLAIVASVPMLVAWAIGVAVYWGNYCGVTPYNSGYIIGHGLGFVIASWASMLVVSALNFFVY